MRLQILMPTCPGLGRNAVSESTTRLGQSLLDRARNGDQDAVATLFAQHRGRLRRVVRLRLHPLVRPRVDESDIIQDALIEASQRIEDYFEKCSMPFFLWLRYIATQQVRLCHRHHLDVQKRTAKQSRDVFPGADSISVNMANYLVSREASPSSEAERREMNSRVRELLGQMSDSDREILCMRHFEQLTNAEVAQVLDISSSNASTRYLRALARLQHDLKRIPGFFDNSRD